MIKSRDIVRRIVEEDGRIIVSFTQHAGYYPLVRGDAAGLQKAIASRDQKRTISFAFDVKAGVLILDGKDTNQP